MSLAEASADTETAEDVPLVDSREFFARWDGHPPEDLKKAHQILSNAGKNEFIFFAGDSSLDNKYWISSHARAVNGWEHVLKPPQVVPDVAHHANDLLEKRGHSHVAVINSAVEATCLSSRTGWFGKLLDADRFIVDTIKSSDTLVVSVGGNDVALSPGLRTIFDMLALSRWVSIDSIRRHRSWHLNHFVRLFRDDVTKYIKSLIAKTKPKRVVVCMIYFPDERYSDSWANTALGGLKYNSNPEKLQATIEAIYEMATSQIQIEGTEVIPLPLFKVLDGKTTADYVQRVEPSSAGSRKMAAAILETIGLGD